VVAGGAGGGLRSPAPLARAAAPGLARRLLGRLGQDWLPRAAWSISRTGRSGLVGVALLLSAAVFLVSTHLRLVAEVEALRADLAVARGKAQAVAPDAAVDPAATLRALPGRDEVPALLGQLFGQAAAARLAIDTAKYEISSTKSTSAVRYQIAFPVTGPYPQIRAFIDATLATMPALAISDLSLERKSIGDGTVEALLRVDLYTRSGP
jgi:Tfp pilus assembly protein PilO